MADYKDVYESFWKQIIEDEKGNINKDQLMKELSDYKYLLDSIPSVYEEVTCHGVSKPFADPKYVMESHREAFINRRYALEDLKNMSVMAKHYSPFEKVVSLGAIEEYLK
ncbi:hypothetical protein [Bacillus atrophaeus]|uniref:Uncharacterized protein n=1 Tax=Bacillus atrophaeus (strain 1942) TaxID=720555 RepID=A0ABM5LX89_BACA1|nr:hypothetical protein [Bacillus atrophaeus]AMR62638.1 hypothetical protein A1D11_09560 [Bacillus subtilis subsp. globigii]ADP32517.1 hypothetical protein BATR1942_07890 [Bacillus atrophaeus 1942]AIK48906.1 hypothetical protein DJ95_1473 [Bacillus atrophaeus subsp. globigii]EIM11687.1 hypothetical protein UY9_05472 [Bacillus atrophaeus C89]KFK81559.1 hypothetical protein DK44_2161 [Bacillus atrophaeus]